MSGFLAMSSLDEDTTTLMPNPLCIFVEDQGALFVDEHGVVRVYDHAGLHNAPEAACVLIIMDADAPVDWKEELRLFMLLLLQRQSSSCNA